MLTNKFVKISIAKPLHLSLTNTQKCIHPTMNILILRWKSISAFAISSTSTLCPQAEIGLAPHVGEAARVGK